MSLNKHSILWLATTLTAACNPAFGSELPQKQRIDAVVKPLVDAEEVVGAVVGIVTPDGNHILSYGSTSYSEKDVPDGDTIFEIGSLTKVFTSVLLAEMVSQDLVKLDDQVSMYLPEGVAVPTVEGMEISRTSQPVSLIDLYPTLVELCDLPCNERLDGLSLTPLLRDAAAKPERPAVTSHGRGNHSVRSQRYRFIRYADGSEELYDHRTDPHEWTNLASLAEHKQLKRELARWIPKDEAKPAPTKRAYDFDPVRYEWRRKAQSK